MSQFAVAAPYQGPGDIQTTGVLLWWGMRAYTKAIANAGTQTLFNLRRSGDNVTADFLVATTGGIGLSTNASDSGASNGLSMTAFSTHGSGTGSLFMAKCYDQTGNGHDMVQATAANQPTVTAGTLSYATFNASSNLWMQTAANAVAQSQPFSAIVFGDCTTTGVGEYTSVGSGAGLQLRHESAASTIGIFAGSSVITLGSVTDNAWHDIQGVFNTTARITADGATGNTGSAGAGTIATNDAYAWGATQGGGNNLIGNSTEGGWWAGDISANFSALSTQAHNFYGV
jgi:hypothetical protein